MQARTIAILALGALAAWTGGVHAQGARPLRLVGEAPSLAEPAPRRFIVDATVEPGDGPFRSEITGWLAALPPDAGSGEVSGSCIEDVCVISAALDEGKLSLTGPLAAAAGPIAGKARFGDEGAAAEARFSVLPGLQTELGELAAPGAVGAGELRELLAWNGSPAGFSNDDGEGAPGDFERGALAVWQGAAGRPASGLILTEDLKALREGAAAEKARAGWTAIGDPARGWSGGYPAAVLPATAADGDARSFASSDGKARLVVAIEPPVTDETFDGIVETETADDPDREDTGYTRVNGDMEVSYTAKGVRTVKAWHARPGGLARLVFTYPAGDEAYARYDLILARSLHLTDAFRAK